MITPSEFKIRFPEFNAIDDTRIQVFIDAASLRVGESEWGNYYNEGLYYLTAHLLYIGELTKEGESGSSSPLASKSIGDVSYSFANSPKSSNSEEYYSSTSYGQEYWVLVGIVGIGIVAVI